jgi:hypothetical protein
MQKEIREVKVVVEPSKSKSCSEYLLVGIGVLARGCFLGDPFEVSIKIVDALDEVASMSVINGVISGVALEVNAKDIQEELGQVVGAQQRMQKPTSSSHSIVFIYEESLSSHVYLGYMGFHARAFMPKPMQCDKYKLFGHVKCMWTGGVFYAS